ncbi:hypothetical protein ACN38_g9663 [Penicillium nordicum]|uniref:Uncharacterized protein n=1 Tax=Penicillium nordicum TaxID=229535 RepID=A0A0M8P399_9EURO|nr:hypothetical protein ACN38_g9663 [Penicillium nordicum]
MVLDGADDAKTFFDRDFARSLVGQDLAAPLASYIPHSEQGFVLITTRDRRLGERLADFNHPLVVPYLEETDAVALLSKKLSAGCDDESRIAELVFELGNLPLAVTQAAAFINENNISVGEYISVLQQSSPVATDLLSEGLADSRRDQSHNSVIRTWGVSFDQILREKPRAAEILSLMACLDRQGIPKTLLRREDESPVGFITALGTLHAFSLIAISPNNATLEMHRLVHLSVQKWLDVTSTRTIYQDEAIKVLSKQFPSKRYEDWYTCRVLYPHAQAALEYTPMSHAALLLRASLLASVSWYDEQQGRFHLAIEKAKDSLQIRERLLDSEHQDTLMSLELVADAADGLDDFRVADEILTRLLAIRERNVGLEHPSTLKTMDSLAQLIARQCQYNRARLLIERTIKLRAKSLGLEHRDTLKSMNTLASILSSVQEFDRAHEIHQKLYEIRSRILGSAHPETLTSLHNLALAVSRQGKYKEAEEMYRQALRGREEALGSDHSSTLTTTNNLAVLLAQQARYEQSEALHRKTLQARQKALGYEHLSTLMAMSNLGDCLRLQDKQIEARGLFIEIYECAKKKYGNAHEYTAMWKDKITLLEKDGADAA